MVTIRQNTGQFHIRNECHSTVCHLRWWVIFQQVWKSLGMKRGVGSKMIAFGENSSSILAMRRLDYL
jgi:hypothetical protein